MRETPCGNKVSISIIQLNLDPSLSWMSKIPLDVQAGNCTGHSCDYTWGWGALFYLHRNENNSCRDIVTRPWSAPFYRDSTGQPRFS